jgi:hypothetical protein
MPPAAKHPSPLTGDRGVERLVVASLATRTEGMFQEMERIRTAALRNNPAAGVHAVLVYLSGWFIFWAEGPPATVVPLVKRVLLDERHHSAQLLHRSQGARMLPNPWSMMLATSAEAAAVVGERVARLRQDLKQGRQYAPTSVLRRLATPMRLPEMQGHADPDAFHRVGICSADSESAFSLVRWLAARVRQPVQHRRVAAEDGRDIGMDTVDFMHGGYPCRANALPRQALLLGLLRLYLPDWPQVLLLFGAGSRADDALIQRVCRACEGLPHPPTLLGVAPDAATHVRMAGAAQAQGLSYDALAMAGPRDHAAAWLGLDEHLLQLGPPASTAWPAAQTDL